MKCQLHHSYLGNILSNKYMINIFNIYVSITVSLLQFIYIILGRKTIQHKMLDNTEYNKKSIDNY